MKEQCKRILFLQFLFAANQAMANRLEDAAIKGTDTILSIAQGSSIAGIALGAALMAFGASTMGRSVLMGGAFAAVAIFGGPAFIDLLKDIFS